MKEMWMEGEKVVRKLVRNCEEVRNDGDKDT